MLNSRYLHFISVLLLLISSIFQAVCGRPGEGACPSMCMCVSRVMHCDRALLTSIPGHLSPQLLAIRLRDNKIRKLGRSSFKGVHELRSLSLTRNSIRHIDPQAFSELRSLVTVSLSENELTLLDVKVFKSQSFVKDLSLSRNNIVNIEQILLPLKSVERLNLAENRLTKITDETFASNSAIRVLYLQNNKINHIGRRAFKPLINLIYLSLKDNPIVQVDIYFWANRYLEQLDATSCGLREVIRDTPPHLRDLRLAANNIEHLEDESLSHIGHVHLLMLDDNLLQVIPNRALANLKSLSDLHITRNKLIELPQYLPVDLKALYAGQNHIVRIANGTLNKLHKLRDLVLSHNRIHEIDEDSFRGLALLVSLDLSFNFLRKLSANTFSENKNLQRLDLSNNPLHVIEPRSFHGLRSLHILQISNVQSETIGDSQLHPGTIFKDLRSLLFLDLSNSSGLVNALVERTRNLRKVETLQDLNLMSSGLTSLPSTLRVYLPYLRAIRLTENPWHCDTRLAWMSRWISSGTVQFYEPERMVCDSPPSLKGRRIMDLGVSELRSAERLPLPDRTSTRDPSQTKYPVSIQFRRVRPHQGMSDPSDDVTQQTKIDNHITELTTIRESNNDEVIYIETTIPNVALNTGNTSKVDQENISSEAEVLDKIRAGSDQIVQQSYHDLKKPVYEDSRNSSYGLRLLGDNRHRFEEEFYSRKYTKQPHHNKRGGESRDRGSGDDVIADDSYDEDDESPV